MATQYDVGVGIRGDLPEPANYADSSYVLDQRDGMDLFWSQQYLGGKMAGIEAEIKAIESNGNLSDTERMFAMQIAMNTWSAISNLRTNMLKSVSDTLKQVVRNIA
ncbi:EscF/YscF/HrpA family type III secretion system needle major subunit [Pseudochelatococcus sp. G4_1912]|uniref:EscF/YscF/HrpA family type III secretion system needle major subunit n=1 Tax=Pseudochelatococcus sp. G4_1912 TaxID=3114288 RepID=UPI0039C6B40D